MDRELPERPRPLHVPVQAQARRRLPRVPRAHEPRQGRPPRAGGRARDRDPAEDRREVPRAARDPLLRRVHPPAPGRLDRVRRRGRPRRQGRAPDGRPCAHLADRLGGAVRPDDDRGDGVRNAGHDDRGGRGPRDRRPWPDGRDRRQLPRHGEQRDARARRLARSRRDPARGRGALLAGAHGRELRRGVRGDDRSHARA